MCNVNYSVFLLRISLYICICMLGVTDHIWCWERHNAAWASVVFISLWKLQFLAYVLNVRIISYTSLVYFMFIELLQWAMDGVYRNCYAQGCTGRYKEGSGNFFNFPRNTVRYVHKIIEHIWEFVRIPYNAFSVPEFINFHILTLMWSLNVSSCITMKFFLHCKIFVYDKFRTQFVIEHALSTLSVHYWG